jgi:hypothetical protein
MTALRNRLVTEQDGQQHVSGLLLADSEIPAALEWEEQLHHAGGWTCERHGAMLRFHKHTATGQVVRWVWVRSRPPLEDNLDP